MIPEVSAGSNQVGASVTCTAQVSWPSGGPAARIEPGTTSAKATARRATTCGRTRVDRLALPKSLLWEEEAESMVKVPTYAAPVGEVGGSFRLSSFRLMGVFGLKAVSLLHLFGPGQRHERRRPSSGLGPNAAGPLRRNHAVVDRSHRSYPRTLGLRQAGAGGSTRRGIGIVRILTAGRGGTFRMLCTMVDGRALALGGEASARRTGASRGRGGVCADASVVPCRPVSSMFLVEL